MIESNSTIPCRKEETFSTAVDNQPAVDIRVFQGERALCKDNKMIGTFVLDGIMPAPRGIPKIKISFDVSADGILKVTATDEATGKQKDVRIEGSSALSKEEIERMKSEASENEANDKIELEKIQKINTADSMVFQTEKQISEMSDKLANEDKTSITEICNKLKEAIASKNVEDVDKLSSELNAKWTEISTKMYQQSPQEGTDDIVEDVSSEEVK
jgi:molecular chaperone DnaK